MHQILAHQEKYRVATIIDITEKDNEYFAILEMKPKFAHMNLPAFCSPAIYQLDASEHDNQLTKWTGLHLAGLDEDPAYGSRIALLRGTCTGEGGICIHQLKTAKQHKAIKLIKDEEIRKLREDIGPGENFPSDGMKRSPQDAQQNFRIQTRGIASDRLKVLQDKTRRGNPKTPLIKDVPFGKEDRPKKNTIGDTLREEDETDAFLSLDFADENNPISVPLSRSKGFSREKLKKPSRKEFKRIIKARLAGMSDEAFRKFKEKEDAKMMESMSDDSLQQMDDIIRQMTDKPERIKKTTPIKPPTTFSKDLKKRLARLNEDEKKELTNFKELRRVEGVKKRINIVEQSGIKMDVKRPAAEMKELRKFIETGVKIDPRVSGIKPKLSPKLKRKLAALRSQTNAAVNRVNLLGTRKRKKKFAFLEPTTTFSDSFKKKKHPIPKIKTSRQEQPTSRFNPKTPLVKEVPFGRKPTKREADRDVVARENISQAETFMPRRFKVKLEKPTQRDRQRIIKARLEKLAIVRSRLAVKIRSLRDNIPKNRPDVIDEFGNRLPKTKRQLASTKREQNRIRKELGAKGIYCTPCTKTALKQLHAQVRKIVGMTGKDIVNKFNANKFSIPKNTGFTFIPETNELIDATASPKDAMKLRARLGVPKGKDLFLEANTVGVSKVEDLAPKLDEFKGQKLIGGFAGEKGFEFDATTSIIGGTKADSIKRLGTTQRQGIRVGGKGDVEFFDNPNFVE